MNQTDDKPALYALTPQQHATVLVALGQYQGMVASMALANTPDKRPINSAHGSVVPLFAPTSVNALYASLNHTGLDFSAVVPLFGEGPDNNAYVLAAAKHVSEGEVEVDDATVVSNSDDGGAYVMAWVWVSNEDARSAEIDGYEATISEDGSCWITKEVKGRTHSATLHDLINEEELVCPTSGMGSDYYHRVEAGTIERIRAWAELVEATLPTEQPQQSTQGD
jgi:hypothetical protein